ncbi:MAG: DMT family transporter [Lachnospiraceae bacterium]|nr:DMT family transporter [Lachnospiraceae bacterium]
MIGVLIAIISGALMSIQGVFNTGLSKQTNLWFSNLFVQVTALIMCFIMFLVTKSKWQFADLLHVKNKYILLGGIIGAFITMTVISSISKLGTAKGIMIIIISQMIVAYLIELFGLFGTDRQPFEIKKAIATIITIVGIYLFKS